MTRYNYRELEPLPLGGANRGVCLRLFADDPLRRADSLKVRAIEVAPGGQTELHAHVWAHQFVVLRGAGDWHDGTRSQALTAGDVVDVPPEQPHQLCNTGSEVLEVLSLEFRRK